MESGGGAPGAGSLVRWELDVVVESTVAAAGAGARPGGVKTGVRLLDLPVVLLEEGEGRRCTFEAPPPPSPASVEALLARVPLHVILAENGAAGGPRLLGTAAVPLAPGVARRAAVAVEATRPNAPSPAGSVTLRVRVVRHAGPEAAVPLEDAVERGAEAEAEPSTQGADDDGGESAVWSSPPPPRTPDKVVTRPEADVPPLYFFNDGAKEPRRWRGRARAVDTADEAAHPPAPPPADPDAAVAAVAMAVAQLVQRAEQPTAAAPLLEKRLEALEKKVTSLQGAGAGDAGEGATPPSRPPSHGPPEVRATRSSALRAASAFDAAQREERQRAEEQKLLERRREAERQAAVRVREQIAAAGRAVPKRRAAGVSWRKISRRVDDEPRASAPPAVQRAPPSPDSAAPSEPSSTERTESPQPVPVVTTPPAPSPPPPPPMSTGLSLELPSSSPPPVPTARSPPDQKPTPPSQPSLVSLPPELPPSPPATTAVVSSDDESEAEEARPAVSVAAAAEHEPALAEEAGTSAPPDEPAPEAAPEAAPLQPPAPSAPRPVNPMVLKMRAAQMRRKSILLGIDPPPEEEEEGDARCGGTPCDALTSGASWRAP